MKFMILSKIQQSECTLFTGNNETEENIREHGVSLYKTEKRLFSVLLPPRNKVKGGGEKIRNCSTNGKKAKVLFSPFFILGHFI